jgi:hypothetical protein
MQLMRTVARSVHEKEVLGWDERFDRGPTDNDSADMDEATLYAWVVRMVGCGKDSSIMLGGKPVCEKPTIGLLWLQEIGELSRLGPGTVSLRRGSSLVSIQV